MAYILWLQDIASDQTALAGAKAVRLATLMQHGLPVPPGFCITTAAYEAALRHSEQSASFALPPDIATEIMAACHQLAAHMPRPTLFAVRSSSPHEDADSASFAGQYHTCLNVPLDSILPSVVACWASAQASHLSTYRQQHHLDGNISMAVMVQVMIPCQVAGVAFSVDPLTGERVIVVEASAGLGHQVVGGSVTPRCYRLFPGHVPDCSDDLLSTTVLQQLMALVLSAERIFGCPQDIEWGLDNDALYLFQARPITTLASIDPVFSEPSHDPQTVWTAGFLNERFPQPVSPLGWSLIRGIFEQRALRDPLRFLGTPDCNSWQVTRLYRGHPYINMRVMQTIYKVFPDTILPDDAARFFIHRDVTLRKKVPYPRGLLDPRCLGSLIVHGIRDLCNWSPFHNDSLWRRFARQYDQQILRLSAHCNGASLSDLLNIAAETQKWNDRLLAIHRWSLTYAEILYGLLQRLLHQWVDAHRWQTIAADLTTGAENASIATNQALNRLAMLAETQGKDGPVFQHALADFLTTYGHRSPSLDIFYPTFADDPEQVLRMIQAPQDQVPPSLHHTLEAQQHIRQTLASNGIERLVPLRYWLVRWIAELCRRYVPLREDQRFSWQKGLALLRRIYLHVGKHMTERGILDKPEDIFFLTASEVSELVTSQLGSREAKHRARSRRRLFERLQVEWLAAPTVSYPPFLVGDRPVMTVQDAEKTMIGVPVSPGLARGPVYIGLSSQDVARVPGGSILVAPSADPGWTAVFPRLGGLVLETGGQLSHAAIVAREYSLPAVTGIIGATTRLRTGQIVIVDGTSGTVILESSSQKQ